MKKSYCAPDIIYIRMDAEEPLTSSEENVSNVLDIGEDIGDW